MAKPRVLVMLDTDCQSSVFDSVVAVDSGVEHLLRHAGVAPDGVRDLVHGAMFTRGPADLKFTAVFVGGSNVADAEAVLRAVTDCFFGPMRVSVMLDPGGCNTTAAAAVVAAGKHLELSGCRATVLGATGPVGRRVVRLLARQGAVVTVCSRNASRAQGVCEEVSAVVADPQLTPAGTADVAAVEAAVSTAQLVIAAGAAGVELLSRDSLERTSGVKVAIDLNAVPPAGIGGIDVQDAAAEQGSLVTYGAIGVGAIKMKAHKAAVRSLFESSDQVLDADEVFAIANRVT